MLQKWGFAVDVAADEYSALELHGLRPYRAIFKDCHMPMLDGYRTTAEIRRRIARTIASGRSRPAPAGNQREDDEPVSIETAVLDPTTLDELCQGDAEMYRDIVGMYLELLDTSVDEIVRAGEAGDDPALSSEAHQLKGSSASIGALRLAEVCEQLGSAARAGWPDGSAGLLQRLRTGAALTTEAMSRGGAAPVG